MIFGTDEDFCEGCAAKKREIERLNARLREVAKVVSPEVKTEQEIRKEVFWREVQKRNKLKSDAKDGPGSDPI